MKRLNEMVLPLCIYYLVGSAVSTVGSAFLESKKEIFTGQIILGTKAEVLFAGLLRILIYLCSALSIYGYYKKESALSEKEERSPQKEITGFIIQNRILRKAVIFLLSEARERRHTLCMASSLNKAQGEKNTFQAYAFLW